MPETVNAQIADALVHAQVQTLRVGATLARAVRQTLADLGADLVRLVQTLDPAAPLRQATRLRRVDNVMEQAVPLIRTTYRQVTSQSTGAIVAHVLRDLTTVTAEVNAIAAVPLVRQSVERAAVQDAVTTLPVPSAATPTTASAPLPEWWQRQAQQLGQRVLDTLRVGVRQGDTLSQLVARLRGTRAHGYQDGVLALAGRDAEALALTAMSAGANSGRVALWDANPEVIKGLVHVSTLDGRTSTICVARSGLLYSVPAHAPIGHSVPYLSGPPYHWRCRSLMNPVFHRYADLLGTRGVRFDEALDALPEGTRASLDGQIPAATTFTQWLERQPVGVQTRLLGQTRRQLWQDGKMTLPQLINQVTGRPVPLAELVEV